MSEWDNQRSRFEFSHRAVGEQLPLCVARVAFDFFKALMTASASASQALRSPWAEWQCLSAPTIFVR
jgi:hypothetical protein